MLDCPPSIAYANSAGAAYIPMDESRGFTPLLVNKLQFVGELRAKKIYGRAIGGNNFFASNKEPYGTPSFKAATDMPTVNNQRALPSGLRDGPREVFPAKKLSPPIAAAKMQSLSKVFVFEHSP